MNKSLLRQSTARPRNERSAAREAQIQDWVRRAAAGEDAAFRALKRQFAPLLNRWVYRLEGCGMATEDAAQEMDLALWGTCGAFRPSRGCAFMTFLYLDLGQRATHIRRKHESYFGVKERGRRNQAEMEAARERWRAERGYDPSVEDLAEAMGRRYEAMAVLASWERWGSWLTSLDEPAPHEEDVTPTVPDPARSIEWTAIQRDQLDGLAAILTPWERQVLADMADEQFIAVTAARRGVTVERARQWRVKVQAKCRDYFAEQAELEAKGASGCE